MHPAVPTTPKDRILAYLNSIHARWATIEDIQHAQGFGLEHEPVAELTHKLMKGGLIEGQDEPGGRVFRLVKG